MRKKHFTKQVGLTISEELYDQLIEETNRREVTVSEWIREAIQSRLSAGSAKHFNRHSYNSLNKERRNSK